MNAGSNRRSPSAMGGMTVVELMVAMAIGLVLVLAAAATLLVGSRGYSTVDSSAQLRQNASFANALIGRITAQAGFRDVFYSTRPATAEEAAAAWPPISGFNNSTVASSGSGTSINTAGNTDTVKVTNWTSGQVGMGSDVLVVRYQPSAKNQDSRQSDGSLFDCSGAALDTAATSRNDVSINVFFVAEDDKTGEPSLSCYTLNRASSGSTVVASRTKFESKLTLVTGVESFQVLYGVQAVSPTENTEFVSSNDTIPHAYLRADQMVVDSDPDGVKTRKNWQLVRSIKIGLVLRGAANQQQERVVLTLYPFGLAKSSADGAMGSAFSSTDDPGTIFTAPADGRFRAVESFTIHLRNAQGS